MLTKTNTCHLIGHIEPSMHDHMSHLSRENLRLRARVTGLEREHRCRSPTKRYPGISATTIATKQRKEETPWEQKSLSGGDRSCSTSPANDDSFVTCLTSFQSSPRSVGDSDHSISQTDRCQQPIPPPKFMLAPTAKPEPQQQAGSVT